MKPPADLNAATQDFICSLITGCNARGYDPVAFLAVRLFETGSCLSSWYQTDEVLRRKPKSGQRLYESFGLLQWTISGAEILNADKRFSIAEQQFLLIRALPRLEQLAYVFIYYDKWQNIGTKVDFNDQFLWHYVKTLSPNGGPDLVQGNNPSPRQIVAGSGAVGKNFRQLKIVAEKMLNGTHPIPNDSPTRKPFNLRGTAGLPSLSQHLKTYGYTNFNPNICNAKVKPAAPKPVEKPKTAQPKAAPKPIAASVAEQVKTVIPPEAQKLKTVSGKKSVEDKLPLKLSVTIPEYPRLVHLKPLDVIILPSQSVYRDWVVESVSREFNQGFNKLTIQAGRPLDPKPFTSLGINPSDPIEYYWLDGNY